MRTLPILVSLAAASTLAAQVSVSPRGSLTTATDYAVFALAGAGDADGVPAGTAIGPSGLSIDAADAAFANSAAAGTRVAFAPTISVVGGAALSIAERGSCFSVAPPAAGGTSNGLRPTVRGPHGLRWRIPARPGDAARIVVSWQGNASAGAFTTATVDVDGDGSADFAARVSGGRDMKTMSFNVRAQQGGFSLGIATSGLAALNGAGNEAYDASLRIGVQLVSNCVFRAFGPECGGKLTGAETRALTRTTLGIRLTNAAPNALAALVIGAPLPGPVPLPASRCALLVTPRLVLAGQTDANGSESWGLGFPTLSLTTAFQALTVQINPAGIRLASSNGLAVSCQ